MRPDRNAGIIWIVTDLYSAKEYEIESHSDVGLAFIDAKANAYLSITARAEVRRDHAKAGEIWNPTDTIWWQGPADPNVCVLLITPLGTEFSLLPPRAALLNSTRPRKPDRPHAFPKTALTPVSSILVL
jgi:general stress protein 26